MTITRPRIAIELSSSAVHERSLLIQSFTVRLPAIHGPLASLLYFCRSSRLAVPHFSSSRYRFAYCPIDIPRPASSFFILPIAAFLRSSQRRIPGSPDVRMTSPHRSFSPSPIARVPRPTVNRDTFPATRKNRQPNNRRRL